MRRDFECINLVLIYSDKIYYYCMLDNLNEICKPLTVNDTKTN